MDVNARHALLREKLDKLGFTQPLPISSIALVSALLDDLILSNNKLTEAKKTVTKLQKEKSAWELGVEPYKCDNSKLLAECNSLHLDIIRQRDTFQHKIFELNNRIRSLEQDNRQMTDRCSNLSMKLNEFESQFEDPKHRKFRNDLLNQKRKPFVSTVRSGEFLPSELKSIENMDNLSSSNKTKCTCQNAKTNEILKRLYAEQEANKVKSHLELIDLYKSQLDSRNREISRLNQLLIGGRPINALAKDCCYRGIKSIVEDVEQLQKEKSQIQAEYEEAIINYHAAIDTIAVLKQQHQKATKELNDLKEIALSVESEANVSLETLHKRNSALKIKLNESKNRILELEMKLRGNGHKEDAKAISVEMQYLHEKLEKASEKETELKIEVERLTKRNAKLKGKLSADGCKCNLSRSISQKDASTITSNQAFGCSDYSIDVNRLKIDRDFYKQEYMKLLNKPLTENETGVIRQQLTEKEIELMRLRKQIEKMRSEKDTLLPCRSVEAAVHRLERERNILQDTVERLTIERNDLRENLNLATTKQREQSIRDELEIDRLKQRIHEIQNENINLHTVQGPAKTTIGLLKNELSELRHQITELTNENSKLRTSNNQLRLLQEQTENVLIEHQSRLTNSERQLNDAESKINVIDSSRTDGCREIGELRAETNRLRNLNVSLEGEKDKLIADLDAKTEKVFQLESQIDAMKTRLIELEAEVTTTHRQLNDVESNRKQNKSSLHQITSEMDELRRQIKQLKKTNDNLMFENRRLTNELADVECTSGVIKSKLSESEKEVDKLKRQLQQYVQEVQRAEELLLRKEEERNEMLEHYRTLSHDAVVLEGTNQSLELEAAETKRTVHELESKISQLEIALSDRDHELTISNGKICELSKQVNQLELDLDRSIHERNAARKELDAIKELCNKLDIGNDKLNAEVNEYSEIKRELERENEQMRGELAMCKAGDKAATESLKQLLASCRKDLEDERIASTHNKNEIAKLKQRIDELQAKCSDEHANAVRQETLAKEYNIQIQELRNQLTDSRFERVRSKFEQSNDRFSSI